jgi:hypothetical protein
MSLQSREHELRSPRMFSKCASCSAAAILARQDHFAERGPPKFSLCERAQSSCGGGETHVRKAPPPSPGSGPSYIRKEKAPHEAGPVDMGRKRATRVPTHRMLSRASSLVYARSHRRGSFAGLPRRLAFPDALGGTRTEHIHVFPQLLAISLKCWLEDSHRIDVPAQCCTRRFAPFAVPETELECHFRLPGSHPKQRPTIRGR